MLKSIGSRIYKGVQFESQTTKLSFAVSRCFSTVDPADYQKEISDIEHELEERKKRKQAMVGIVVSDKNSKSVTVKVEHEKWFPKYNKAINFSKKFMVHDEAENCEIGDLVRIVPCKPMSKMKRHEVIDVIKKAQKFEETDNTITTAAKQKA